MEFIPVSGTPNLIKIQGVVDIRVAQRFQKWLKKHPEQRLDLREVEEFDTASALVLWEHWQHQVPPGQLLTPKQRLVFQRIQNAPESTFQTTRLLRHPRRQVSGLLDQFLILRGLLDVSGRFLVELASCIYRPTRFPLRELSAACYRSGVAALPITVIVGFLIGIVISYLSSLSLQDFGAESFLPLVLGVGILRELGPLLTSIVLAGRSGSAITAGLAAMRLTQELDALSALGISHSRRLVLPRVVALAVMTPLLSVCTNVAALTGGMMSGWVELDLPPGAFVHGLRVDVPLSDMWIGLFKSTVFGATVGIIACYFGLSAKANTESLATHTTRSVVLSISAIILLDAVFAILFKDI